MEERTDLDIADIAQKIIELLVCLRCFVLRILRADPMEQATSAFTKWCQGCTHMEPFIVGGGNVDATVFNYMAALLSTCSMSSPLYALELWYAGLGSTHTLVYNVASSFTYGSGS